MTPKRFSTLTLACISALASFGVQAYTVPDNFESDQSSQGAGYFSGTINGNGYNWTVDKSTDKAAGLQVQNGGQVNNVGNLTVVDGLITAYGGSIQVNNKLETGTLKLGATSGTTVTNTGTVTAGSATVSSVIVNSGSSLTVTNNLDAKTLTNSGTTTVGSLKISGGLSNAAGATLTVGGDFEMTPSGKDPTLSNAGNMFFSSGKLDAEAFKLVNSGTLGKSQTEGLDEIVAREVRNDKGGTISAGKITSAGTVYNGETSTGTMTVNVLEAKALINGTGGTLNVKEKLIASLYNKGGTVTLNDVESSVVSNSGTLTVNGNVNVTNNFSNQSGGTVTFGADATFADAAFALTNAGTLYVQSGTLDASGMTLTNSSSGVIRKNEQDSKLDALVLANLRNEADLAVSTLKATGDVYNGETSTSSMNVTVLEAQGLINGQGGTVNVNEKLSASLYNKGGEVTLKDVEASVVSNSGTLTVNGNANVTKNFSNLSGGTVTFGADATFADAAFTLTNAGTLYAQSGKIDAAGMTLKNLDSGVIRKNAQESKLDALVVANLHNNADLTVSTLKATGDVYNGAGDEGNSHTLTVDTLTAKSIFNDNGSKVVVSDRVSVDSVKNSNGSEFTAQTLSSATVTNETGSSLTVTNLMDAQTLINNGTTTVGSLKISNRLTNAAGATLTVGGDFEMTPSGNDPTLSNSGNMFFSSGKLNAEAFKLVNSGTLGKSQTEGLDEIVAREVRNDKGGTISAGKITSAGTVYNGETSTGTMTVNVLEAKALINGKDGTLTVNDKLIAPLSNKGGSVTLKDVEASVVSNNGTLSIQGNTQITSYFSNDSGSTVTFGADATFADAAFTLTNAGTLYAQSGKIDASGMTLRNFASGVIRKNEQESKLDALVVANLRNNADLAVSSLKTTGYVYNGEGEQGGGHTLTVDTLAADSVLNDNGSTVNVSDSVTAGVVRNINVSKFAVKTLSAAKVSNESGGELTSERITADWIVNEEAKLDADAVEVWRLTNELGSTLDVDALVMKRDADGNQAWLQLRSDKATHIGSLSGEDIYAGLTEASGEITIDKIEAKTGIAFHMPDIKADRVTVLQNDSRNVSVVVDKTITDTLNPDDIKGGMQQVASTLNIENGEKSIDVKAEAGTILGELNARTDAQGNVVYVDEEANEFNVGISEMASAAMMAWRAENNDLFKRLGEVRRGDDNNGLWARVTAGKSEYGKQNLDNEYTTLQFGYDHRVGEENQWILGGAFTYTNGDSTFENGTGDNYQFGLALYGSYLGATGGYVDVIGKYSRLHHEFDVNGGAGAGEYYGNGLSLSIEAGHRFDVKSLFYVEPQVEFTYGYLTDASYETSAGAAVAQDSMKTAVGRVGFNVGKAFEKGSVHVGASYLKDFEGDTSVAMSYKGFERHYAQDLGGDWFEFELGGAYAVRDNLRLYGTFETTTGGELKTPWQANVGVRLTW